MSTNCAPLLADFFLYSYKADFIHGLLKKNEVNPIIIFTSRYINDAFSLNSWKCIDFVICIYPIELEINNTKIELALLHTLAYTSKLTIRTC